MLLLKANMPKVNSVKMLEDEKERRRCLKDVKLPNNPLIKLEERSKGDPRLIFPHY